MNYAMTSLFLLHHHVSLLRILPNVMLSLQRPGLFSFFNDDCNGEGQNRQVE